MKMLEAALKWHNAGCSVIPIRADGTKKPLLNWNRHQVERLEPGQLENWFGRDPNLGIGVICGAVSGGLEMLELEGRAADGDSLTKIHHEAVARGIDWLFASLTEHGYSEWTPSGGIHMLYRVTDHEVPGNTKVARRPATEEELEANPGDKVKVLAETRGEGGYVIVAPTAGTVHPSGESWSLLAGELGVIPTVSWADRCLLHEAITAALDEMPQPVAPPKRQLPAIQRTGLLPGEDFSNRATWEEILTPHGWSVTEYRGNETFWIRPGKKFEGKGSHSATTGLKGDGAEDRLYVFSTSTEFDAERPYNKFAAYTLLEHRGDFAAAAKELSRRGYGSAKPAAVAYASQSFEATSGAVSVRTVLDPAPDVEVTPEAVIPLDGILPDVKVETLRRHTWDDRGAAGMYAETFAGHLRYVSTDNEWRVWNDGCWSLAERSEHEWAMQQFAGAAHQHATRLDDEGATAFGKFAGKLATAARIAAIPRLARSNPSIAACATDFDAHTHLVTVANGTLNLNTMQLGPHDPKLMLTKKMNAAYLPEAGTGRWGTFMEQVLPDAGVRGFLQRAFGYALLGKADQRALFLLHGESGSGKSQVLEGVAAVMGDLADTIPDSVLKPRAQGAITDDIHSLHGTRLAMHSELEENSVLNEGLIKSATGMDTLRTRALYGKYVKWRPQFAIFLATNFLPRISSTDNAIWRRVKPIKFEQCFVDSDGNPLDPDSAGIGHKLAAEEPECVLNWLLEGLAAYLREGLDQPEQVRQWTHGYRDESDTVRQFVTEGESEGRIKVEDGLEAGFRDLYRAYGAWCQDNAIRAVSSRRFNMSMEAAKFTRARRERGVVWQGVGIIGFLGAAQQPALGHSYHQRL